MEVQNYIEVVTRTDGKYDFRIRAKEDHNILCSSDQGYEDTSECLDIAKRVTTAPAPVIHFVAATEAV